MNLEIHILRNNPFYRVRNCRFIHLKHENILLLVAILILAGSTVPVTWEHLLVKGVLLTIQTAVCDDSQLVY